MGAKLLPPFDEFGYSPPGIHACRVEELVARFGSGSPEREVETQELIDFFAWARRVGFERVIVNGSYVTSKAAPNYVDVVFLPAADLPAERIAIRPERITLAIFASSCCGRCDGS
jgi:hypothetical protein